VENGLGYEMVLNMLFHQIMKHNLNFFLEAYGVRDFLGVANLQLRSIYPDDDASLSYQFLI